TTAVILLPADLITQNDPSAGQDDARQPTRRPAMAAAPPIPTTAEPLHTWFKEPPQAAVPAPEPPPPAAPDDDVTGGLPRRTRQASLAPGLRRAAPRNDGGDHAATKSPEQARATMSALQQGFHRGRGL